MGSRSCPQIDPLVLLFDHSICTFSMYSLDRVEGGWERAREENGVRMLFSRVLSGPGKGRANTIP